MPLINYRSPEDILILPKHYYSRRFHCQKYFLGTIYDLIGLLTCQKREQDIQAISLKALLLLMPAGQSYENIRSVVLKFDGENIWGLVNLYKWTKHQWDIWAGQSIQDNTNVKSYYWHKKHEKNT